MLTVQKRFFHPSRFLLLPLLVLIGLMPLSASCEVATVSGTVHLEAWPLNQVVLFSFSSATRAYFFTRTVTLSENGAYSLPDIPPDLYRVQVKGPIWLAAVSDVDTRQGSAAFSLALPTGDVNKDNRVDAADLALFALAYGSDWTVRGGAYNADCDLNHDGKIDAADLGLLTANYGSIGAELPAGTPSPLSRVLPAARHFFGDTDPPAPHRYEYALAYTEQYDHLKNETPFAYVSARPEKIRFEDDFTPDSTQKALVLATRNAVRFRAYAVSPLPLPNGKTIAPGTLICEVKFAAAEPKTPPLPASEGNDWSDAARNMLRMPNLGLLPGKTIHLVIDFDDWANFETAPNYALSYGMTPEAGSGCNGLTLYAVYLPPTPLPVRAEAVSAEKPTYVGTLHEIRTARYSVTGDKDGLVKFADFKRQTSNHFQMDAGKWARECFVLDDGKTVAASQEDHAVFWDAATGKEIGRVPEHVYGFSHDQKHFIAQNGRDKISLYEYPAMKRVAQFQPPMSGGVCAFLFSPDDRYCAVEFEYILPIPEATYPNMSAAFKNYTATQLYCLDPVSEVPKFTLFPFSGIGSFAADSSAYFGDSSVEVGREEIAAPWRYDFKTRKIEAVKYQK